MSLTIEESTTESISPILNHILTKLLAEKDPSDLAQKDILFICIIALMIENNFLLINEDLETIELMESYNLEQFLNLKLYSGLYEALFALSGFKTMVLKLIMSPLGAMSLVNIVIKELHNETYTVCLPMNRYVVSPQATSIPMIFQDLKHFSVTVKNKIISPVKSKILHHFGYASASLVGLPEELILKIVLYLPIIDIVNVCRTCHRLSNVIKSRELWRHLCKRDFNSAYENVDERDWKSTYQELYKVKNEKKPMFRLAGTMHDLMEYSDYISYIDNPMWDVII